MLKKSIGVLALLSALASFAKPAEAQSEACSTVTAAEPSAADTAYQQGKYEIADSLYQQELALKPNDPVLNAALVRTQLREGRLADAAARAANWATAAPHSAAALTALAEVQLRKGLPWLALQTLDAAMAEDPCYARLHLIRSRIFRIDSMYASERKEIATAYQIDPSDADIHRAWAHTVNPANDIVRIQDSLASMTDLEPEVREKASASAKAMMSLLSENSQTCQSPPLPGPVTLPLLASYETVKQIGGYKLEVQLAKGKAKLMVDTAASGLYISRALTDANGFAHADGAPAGTVEVESVHIGPLEFRNCMVGVSEAPFADGVDGYIGTDLFAPYLVGLNFPEARLELAPLPAPATPSALPGDRSVGPEMQRYTPVYHKNQYLLVPVMLNRKDRRLFVLDSGIRLTTLTSQVAHSLSNTRVNFTNSVETVSGGTLQIYRDTFDFEFAGLSLDHRDRILEFDPSAVEQGAGMEVAGLLGFDMLHSLVLHIDYRDGLVLFASAAAGVPQKLAGGAPVGAPAAAAPGSGTLCPDYAGQNVARPLNTAIRGAVVGSLDSGHLAPGQAVQLRVTQEWNANTCALRAGSMLYGRVLQAKAAKGASQLAMVFDQGDCSGHPRQGLSLRVVSVRDVASTAALHSALPTEVAGGARAISSSAAGLGNEADDDITGGAATYRAGMVEGIRHLTLTPEGGPQCSALLTSDERSVHLGAGAEFILTMQSTP